MKYLDIFLTDGIENPNPKVKENDFNLTLVYVNTL